MVKAVMSVIAEDKLDLRGLNVQEIGDLIKLHPRY